MVTFLFAKLWFFNSLSRKLPQDWMKPLTKNKFYNLISIEFVASMPFAIVSSL